MNNAEKAGVCFTLKAVILKFFNTIIVTSRSVSIKPWTWNTAYDLWNTHLRHYDHLKTVSSDFWFDSISYQKQLKWLQFLCKFEHKYGRFEGFGNGTYCFNLKHKSFRSKTNINSNSTLISGPQLFGNEFAALRSCRFRIHMKVNVLFPTQLDSISCFL